jgi:hypothetical protein
MIRRPQDLTPYLCIRLDIHQLIHGRFPIRARVCEAAYEQHIASFRDLSNSSRVSLPVAHVFEPD